MKVLREYQIPYVGLKIGNHTFQYEIDDRFFKAFEGALIGKCKVKVRLEFEKKETLFILNFFIDGTVNVVCDRCSESFDKEIFGDFQCLVKYKGSSDDLPEDGDEILYISREDSHIDASELIYDYINLCLPMQLVHPDNVDGTSSCNSEVLRFLKAGEQTKNEPSESDPRWAVLQKFKSEN